MKPVSLRLLLAFVPLLGMPLSCKSTHSHSSAQQPETNRGDSVGDITPNTPILTPAKPTEISLLVDLNNAATRDLETLRMSDVNSAKLLEVIVAQPTAVWFGERNSNIETDARNLALAAKQAHATALLVVYAIPHRDCGNYSTGGLAPAAYQSFVQKLAFSLGQTPAFIIVEPDALTLTDCMQGQQLQERFDLLRFAVKEFKKNPHAKVYLDAGHSAWLSAEAVSTRLRSAGIAEADGFALNVSNYQTSEDSIRYGQDIRSRIGDKSFVIDTSRNGRGPVSSEAWCNPPGRAIGHLPQTPTGLKGLDAYLWIKRPGESDGTCNGGPAVGQWWREMALELARNASLK